jgi:hypothetical protein
VLSSIAAVLEVRDNARLASLDATNGFEGLTDIQSHIRIYNNPLLLSIGGFTSLQTANADIEIYNNGLTSLSGFPALTDVIGTLNIANNVALQSINGFGSLGQLGGSLIVRDSDALTQMNGFDSLVNIGLNLTIVSNPSLTNITGLLSGTLQSGALGNLYQIAGNPLVSSCEVNALRTALGVSGTDQSGANSGCTTCSGTTCTAGAGTTDGQQNVFYGSAALENTQDLAWMKNVVALTGSLRAESTTLPHVNGLANLATIGDDFIFTSNNSLTNLNGLSGLTSVAGDMNIQSNGALTNINGLSALTSVGGFFQIYNNAVLTNVGGLTSLTTVGAYMNIQSNAQLTNLDGLDSLDSVGTTTSHYLQIYGNGNLTSILGLITPTGGTLSTLTGNLTIQQNSDLSSCQATALRDFLATQGWARTFNQSGNLNCGTSCGGTGNTVCQ